MKPHPAQKITLIAFALVCLACAGAMTFMLYDVVTNASGSSVSGFGAASVFIMVIAFAARRLWESREHE